MCQQFHRSCNLEVEKALRQTDQDRFNQILSDLRADASLERQLMRRFIKNEARIRRHLRNKVEEYSKKRFDHLSEGEIEVKIQKQVDDIRGIVHGRLIRPVLRHLFLIAYFPLSEESLMQKARNVNYEFELIAYHYNRIPTPDADGIVTREFPQSFLKDFLVKTMKGDISKSAAYNVLELLDLIGLATRIPLVTSRNNGLAIQFDRRLKKLVGTWLDMRHGGTNMPIPRGKYAFVPGRYLKVAAISAIVLFATSLLATGIVALGTDRLPQENASQYSIYCAETRFNACINEIGQISTQGSNIQLADAQSEWDTWKDLKIEQQIIFQDTVTTTTTMQS